ncbi:hypothetical protein SAMN05421858_5079 [Haladaptatus litoreus]|uniref:Uncharacterized protein n=1 Tax=Haladaptatus litoreus TaxID=553468 RepID=A0A1N7FI61_9EURY|nr:hypothetical protein [Haladaptatus litoreus]SIR99925.1 hypothetical protein SAMN05421858_5079 [Haladaptatus litoreus]
MTELTHDHYGDYDEQPHTEIEMYFSEWHSGAQEALEYKLGPAIAWKYDDGSLYLWGENLDENTLRNISDACHEVEADHRDMAIYDSAQDARNASSKIIGADIER